MRDTHVLLGEDGIFEMILIRILKRLMHEHHSLLVDDFLRTMEESSNLRRTRRVA